MGDTGRVRKHRLLFELGRGGMGTVYLAVAEGPGGFSKLKVVKQLSPMLVAEPQFLNMFLDEARLSALLNHPNIVQTNEVGFDGRDYFIEMEFLEGQPYDALTRRAAKGGGLPLLAHLWILTQVLCGLHHAHELTSREGTPLAVVHRDVSPHNVFVTYEGMVKVLDFGIAKAIGAQNQTSTGVVKGKATYMSPEQAMRRPVDRRADVFAAGIMLWEALTGKRFWADFEDGQIFPRLELGDYPTPKSVVPDIPDELDAICMRALAVDPEKRYPTAAEFQEAIEQHLESTGAKIGSRAVGKLVTTLFAERRAAIAKEIQEQLGGRSDHSEVSVPVLGASTAYQRTATGNTMSQPLRIEATVHPRLDRTSSPNTRRPGEPPGLEDRRDLSRDGRDVRPEITGTKAALESSVTARSGGNGWRRHWSPRTIIASVTALLLAGGGITWMRGRTVPGPAPAPSASAPVARPGACSRNAECLRDGATAICRKPDGVCVALTSPYCRILAEPGDVDDDATIWFGSMFPTSALDANEVGKPYERGMVVAREDFVKMAKGLPQPDGMGSPRPLAILACDDTDDPAAVARHLADVGVPAVIGFANSAEVIDLSTTVFLPKHILAVATMDGSPLIAQIPTVAGDPRMVVRTTAELYAMSVPLAKLVAQVLEPYTRSKDLLAPNEAFRVTLIRLDTLTQVSLGEDIVKALKFNGMPALDNARNFDEVVVHTIEDTVGNAKVVAHLAEFAPHVILFTGGDGFASALFAPLEERWRSGVKHRPIYVRDSDIDGPAVIDWLTRHPEVRSRFYGMYGPLRTPANLRFTTRYNEGLPKPVPYTMAPSPSFDAFYMLAYAAFAVGHDPITGPNLARAMEKLLPPGEPVDVGAAHIYDVIRLLREGRRVDLGGAATNLNLDARTGDVASDALLYCMRAFGSSLESDELPIAFRSATGKWTGTLGCPQ